MIWITTDTHFGHRNIIKLANRPENYEELIITNWKAVVSPEDTVIHLGDVAWGGKYLSIIKELPGQKILVRGNHDPCSLDYYMQRGFNFACDSLTMKRYGIDMLFTHAPRIFHEVDVNIHGHLHNLATIKSCCLHYPIALECNGYKMIDLDVLVRKELRALVTKTKQEGVEEWEPLD